EGGGKRPAELRRQDRRGVGAEAEESRVAELQDAPVPEHELQPEREHGEGGDRVGRKEVIRTVPEDERQRGEGGDGRRAPRRPESPEPGNGHQSGRVGPPPNIPCGRRTSIRI